MELTEFLKIMVAEEGSDLYLTTGAKPMIKAFGQLKPIHETILPKGAVKKMAYDIMDVDQKSAFEQRPEMNLALSLSGIGRFRVNIFVQRAEISMVIRSIKSEIPTVNALGLPPILSEVIMEKRGLILFVGATGAGKSTTLAALINQRNEMSAGHIITIEDPIEFVHTHKQSIVNQREIGMDTLSYEDALKNTLRQAPDVILIGEIRTRETMEHAIAFSETGHLCLSTLHANNANQALDRMINFFPENRKKQLLLDLSFNLKAIVSQRILPTLDGKRICAFEVMLGTPLILDLIQRDEIESLKEVMEKSENLGMQTFDKVLEKLYFQNKISLEEAIRNADSKNNLRLKITLKEKGHQSSAEQTVADTEKSLFKMPPNTGSSGLSIADD
ncbi:MAG: PilT/PilU family type 4a pilus ATPase [Gammaproteobacteria bacterium]